MLLYISGQLMGDVNGGTSGIPSLDAYSAQWKDNVEGWFNHFFGVPQAAWNTSDDGGLTKALADNITHALGNVLSEVGTDLLRMAPGLMLVVCMGCILGMMIGSERCKHWASVSALATLVLQVVDRLV